MPGADQETLDYYSQAAGAYADRTAEEADSPALARFAAMLPPGGSVLDFGSGHGWAAARFRDMGFGIRAIDGSPGLAEEGRRRFGLDIEVCQFDAFTGGFDFDGVWASFSLLHDTRDAMPGHLARLYAALRPGGALYVGLKEGEGAARDRLGRRYTYFTLPEMEGLLAEAGFTLLHHDREVSTGMDGVDARCLHLFARRD